MTTPPPCSDGERRVFISTRGSDPCGECKEPLGKGSFELTARAFYLPVMAEIVRNTGVRELRVGGASAYAFPEPCQPALVGPPRTRHVLGTLRMGADPTTSVTNGDGRFHDLDNLWAADGGLLPTSSGWNPTLTIIAVALKVGHAIAGARAALAAASTHRAA